VYTVDQESGGTEGDIILRKMDCGAAGCVDAWMRENNEAVPEMFRVQYCIVIIVNPVSHSLIMVIAPFDD
jgi:hypothetical protein